MANSLMTKEPLMTMGEGAVSLINGVKKTVQPHTKKHEKWTTILHHTQKFTQSGLKT